MGILHEAIAAPKAPSTAEIAQGAQRDGPTEGKLLGGSIDSFFGLFSDF